jgi:porin
MKQGLLVKTVICIGVTLLSTAALAEESEATTGGQDNIMGRETLTGNWGGQRDALEERGITFEMAYTGEWVSNFDNGLVNNKKETIYEDDLDLTMTVDTEKAGMWQGGTFFLYGLRNHGGDPSGDVIGDLQTASNIEAPNKVLVQEAWYQQEFSGASVLFGLHDLNSEFYVSDYSGLFLNSSPGIGAEVSGNVPVSLFPKAGLALRLHVDPTDNWYVQTAVYDGDPSTRAVKSSEGKMYILETGVDSGSGVYKVGYWNHTADITYNSNNFSNDYGYYGIIDQKLLALEGDRGIGGFIRWGTVPAGRNEITGHVDLGLNMHGLIPGRNDDEMGIAYIRADTHVDSEVVYELTYRAVIVPWLAIQPSYQMINNPGGDSANPDINVGLLRFEITI